MESQPPKLFISYSHDSPDHEARVLTLANRLRGDGIDTILDQYETFPPQGWIRWMNQQVRDAQFVLVVCTETYCRRAAGEEEPGTGMGATHESGLIQQKLYDSGGVNKKFLLAVFTAQDRAHVPLDWRRYPNFLISDGYEDLYRLLTGQPKTKKPGLGPLRALPSRQAKPDFRNSLRNVPVRNPWFTGREPYLQAIHKILTQNNAAALSGIGGIGKTQTAIEYAHRHRGDYQTVLWCSADTDAPLLSGFAALANILDLPERNEKELEVVARGVTRWLESHSGWLLILDNIDIVEDLNIAGRLISSGHRLITTRLQAMGRIAKLVEIDKMDPQDGALFLLRRAGLLAHGAALESAPEADRIVAAKISNEVDGLPLALDQAGAYIEETPSTLAEYLTFYQTEGARLRKLRGEIAAEHTSVTVTFSLAFSRLAGKNSAAADLLRVCTFLAPDAIPEEIFTQSGEALGESLSQLATKPLDFAEAIRDAGRFALIRRDAAAKSLNMHRQVQEVLKDEMDEVERHLWAGRVVENLSGIFPVPEFRNWPQCERLLPHARAASRHIADFRLHSLAAGRLLILTARHLIDRAEYIEAEPLLQRALDIWEEEFGPDHPNTAGALNNLAESYRQQGRYEQAEPLYQRALAICEKALRPDHPVTGTSLNNLATLYYTQGRYERAEPLYQRSLAIRERELGPDHADTVSLLNNLADLHYKQGRYEHAEPLLERALAIREKALGPNHPETAASLNILALLCTNQGRYDQAEPLYQRALAIREKSLGPDHPTTAVSLHNLATLHFNQRRYKQAEPLFQRALGIWEKALGLDHPDNANSLNDLAMLYANQGLYEQAQPLCQRSLVIIEKAMGPDHPDTATSLNNLAFIYLMQDRYRQAEPLYLRALAIREKALGPDHPATTEVRSICAELQKLNAALTKLGDGS